MIERIMNMAATIIAVLFTIGLFILKDRLKRLAFKR